LYYCTKVVTLGALSVLRFLAKTFLFDACKPREVYKYCNSAHLKDGAEDLIFL
jgi:hypothetical protein